MKINRTIIITGAVMGFLSSLLIYLGNPANMGICVACFIRDTAGALGLHQAEIVQYIRPELLGFILGAFIISSVRGEFRATGGSSPMTRFFLGVFLLFGALVFLGCPLRMIYRLAGGDMTALSALGGFIFGIYIGLEFLKRGFTLGKSHPQRKASGFVFPAITIILLLFLLLAPEFIAVSQTGPGSLQAPLFIALGAGILIGILAQRSRFCTAGGIRDMILLRNPHLFSGLLSLFLTAFIFNLFFGQFSFGFEGQPVAHNDWLWNFLGMTLVGITSVFLGGCPLRQSILAGEGNGDSAVAFMGMLVGGALAHNLGIAASPQGVGFAGQMAVILGLILIPIIGFTHIERN